MSYLTYRRAIRNSVGLLAGRCPLAIGSSVIVVHLLKVAVPSYLSAYVYPMFETVVPVLGASVPTSLPSD